MPAMTPAERLLAAADLLDKRAGEATEGPWLLARHRDGRILGIDAHDGYDDVVTTGDVRCMSYCYGGTSTIEAADADWRYIATMHPEVGKALTAWLRTEAGRVFNVPVVFGGRALFTASPEALALADVLLAGAS